MGHHIHRQEQSEHLYVRQAKEWAKQAGTDDNRLINWAVKLQEERLVFENRPQS